MEETRLVERLSVLEEQVKELAGIVDRVTLNMERLARVSNAFTRAYESLANGVDAGADLLNAEFSKDQREED